MTMRDLHARRPANRTAALVVAPSGTEEWEPSPGSNDSLLPIPFAGRPHWIEDLVGITAGSFWVVGFHSDHPKKGPRWVVRCQCGVYSVRGQRALANVVNNDDRCDRCRKLRAIRKQGGRVDRFVEERNQGLVASPVPQNTGIEDLTGLVVGRLTVIGYYGSHGNGAVWLVQCTCGQRGTRKTRSLKNRPPDSDSCDECHALAEAAARRPRP